MRVLVVDDEPAVRGALATSLGQRGFSVLTASDLRSAMRVATTHRPDIILVDIRLGAQDGLELVHLLRAADLDIPCVVLTGHAGPYDGFRARDVGVTNLVEKPSSPDKIAAVLRGAVMELRATNVGVAADGYAANGDGDAKPSIPLRCVSTALGSERADRLGRVLAGLIVGNDDVHSIDGLCERAPIGVAPSTFRRWCGDLQVNPALAVEFARLLRAIARTSTHGMSPSAWLDMDRRTFDKLLDRGGLTESFAEQLTTLSEFIRTQQFINNPLVLDAVGRYCTDWENGVRRDPTR